MLNLLYIEDDPADFQLLVRHLARNGLAANVVRVDAAAALDAALTDEAWDAVLTDYNVPGLPFGESLALVSRRLPDVPIILVSGSIGDEAAVELLKEGVWDFVLKDNLLRLCPAIERGLRDSAQRRGRQAIERALQESEERFRLIAATINEAIWMSDAELQRTLYISPAYERIWQRSCASLYDDPSSFLDAIHPDDRDAVLGDRLCIKESRQPFEHEYRIVRPDGSVRWVRDSGKPVCDAAGQLRCHVGVVEDITERRQAEVRLRQAATVFENSRECVIITGLDGTILAVNKAFTEITGYTEAEVISGNPRLLQSDRHGRDFFQAMWNALTQAGQWQGEIWNRRKNGEIFPCWLNIAAVPDERGRPTQYVAVFADISQIRHSEEQLARLAHYDPLTDLPNRLLLQSRLEHAIDRAGRHGQRLAVLFIDLDHFKTINDSLSHLVGDRLLVGVADRLRQRIRSEDTLGRFGGDEFLLILEPLDHPDEAAGVARDLLAALTEPFRLDDGQEFFVGASIGISVYPEDGATATELLRDADAAMYQAKENGRNRFCFYIADMNINASARLQLEADLRRALDRDEFVLYYQPKVDIVTGLISGAEALIRWQRGGTLLAPGHFIPLAEKTGLIVQIGTWVIDAACCQLRAWREAGWIELRVAVNVSSRQFFSGDLVAIVAQALARHDVPAACLELEVTESMLMDDPEKTVSILQALKAIGVKLSLDDFGTGYSSFAYLSRFPIDTLKIDQSFVAKIVSEPDAAMIAVSIIDLAHRLRLKVVAEGVETVPQLAYLRSRGCDEMQGYYFARPLPADEFVGLVAAGKCLPAAEAPPPDRTLLLVDDEPNVLAALCRLLRKEGYRILTADSGAEGLELLATQPVQVILSDHRMPRMTGTEFLRRVKSLHPDTVRLVLSGYADLESVTYAVNEGAIYKYLHKPWDDELLRAHIRDAFLYHEAVVAPRARLADDNAAAS
jgi:diguanylate cyclase (GGDEF)-like protein/PAS domain S-box-containing protein